ncbi:MAG TPA: hypothetical protein VJJ27_01025 [Candidatus Paceibacterota bacterium]
MRDKSTGSEQGQAVFELIIALAVLVLVFSSSVSVILGGQAATTDAQEGNKAAQFARQGLESSFGMAQGTFANLVSTTSAINEFSSNILVSDLDLYTKEVESRINWATDPLRDQRVDVTVLITDWKSVQALGGDTGGTGPTGDWSRPRTLGSIDLGAGENATDLDVVNKIVYMTTTASSVSKPDFFIVNVFNPQAPFIVSSLNTGSGLLALDVINNYAFVVGKDNAAELQIINISNPASPSKVAALDLPGDADAQSVYYYNDHLFIGRVEAEDDDHDAGPEFEVVDVSDPLGPLYVTGLSGLSGELNRIFVLNNVAYVGTEDNTRGMYAVDVANPAAPFALGSYNAGSHVYGVFAVSNSKIYLGAKTNFYAVNAADPASIQTLGSKSVVGSGIKIIDLYVAGPYAFLATEDPNKEFQVLNVSNPASITAIGTFNFPNIATGIDYENNLVYVSVRSNDGLKIITSQ